MGTIWSDGIVVAMSAEMCGVGRYIVTPAFEA